MTMTADNLNGVARGPRAGRELFRADPIFAIAGLLLLLAMVPTGVLAVVDQRDFQGVDIWDKPLKFQFALAVYLLTLAAAANFFPQGGVKGLGFRIYQSTVVLAVSFEMAWIAGAAWLGLPSHFNTTELGSLIYRSMGGLAIWLTGASMVYGVVIARSRNNLGMPLLKMGLATGLLLTLPLTAITAGYMSVNGGHWVGGLQTDAGGFLLMGWSRTGGDLRVAHFFATHAMHIVPLASMALGSIVKNRGLAVALAALGTLALVGSTFAQALSGQPFLGFLN